VKSNGPSAETFLLSSASAQAGVHPGGATGSWQADLNGLQSCVGVYYFDVCLSARLKSA
jgi:hypothetical protein